MEMMWEVGGGLPSVNYRYLTWWYNFNRTMKSTSNICLYQLIWPTIGPFIKWTRNTFPIFLHLFFLFPHPIHSMPFQKIGHIQSDPTGPNTMKFGLKIQGTHTKNERVWNTE